MSAPIISILLPVYNAEQYLKEAIESLLGQTFRDFELLIINDGSTDNSESVIQSFTDPRIVYLKNKTNKGIVYTLNRGVKLANGKYIARMDADDISLPNRILKQFEWLERFHQTDVVGCHVSFIDEDGKATGEWQDDLESPTYRDIVRKMVWESCIAHSSVMMRSSTIKEYLYKENQRNTEDYDLWLRLLADGIKIQKVPEKLLLYRVHEASITGTILRKSNPFLKLSGCKIKFLSERIWEGEWGFFESKVALTAIYDAFMGFAKEIKGAVKN
jgi:glycosyltransferase involved in cell wall biosynthesis